MKLLFLTHINFFRFNGTKTIQFSTDTEKNVTVIRGENGTGKTTLLNAFYWCFYGDITPPLTEDKILNDLAFHLLPEGGKTEAGIEIRFADKTSEYVAKRVKRYMKKNGSRLFLDDDFSVFKVQPNGNHDSVETKNFFSHIIPKDLRGFFFFDGERIDRLAKIEGQEEIKKAILDILGLTNIESALDHIDHAEREFTKNYKKFTNFDDTQLINQHEDCCERIEKDRAELERKKTARNVAKKNFDIYDGELQRHNSTIIAALANEQADNTDRIKEIKAYITVEERAINDFIASDFKHYLASFVFDKVYNDLDDLRKKGELPSDIKAQFIQDLLNERKCICGRPIDEGSLPEQALKAKMKTAGHMDLDAAYHRLVLYINSGRERSDAFFSSYYDKQQRIANYHKDLDKLVTRNSEIKTELDNSPEDQIALNSRLRQEAHDEMFRLTGEINLLESTIARDAETKERLSKQIENLQVQDEQAKQIKKQRDMAKSLGQLATEFQAYFVDTTRKELAKTIETVFDLMKEKQFRKARLTDNFRLEVYNDSKEDTSILSTGEGQIASLAFIGSLVSYAREKQRDAIISEFSGGDFPIVMDSPFGYLSSGHKSNVAKHIGTLASQVVVIVSDAQWSHEVQENIVTRAGKMYKMRDGNLDRQEVGEHTVVEEINNA